MSKELVTISKTQYEKFIQSEKLLEGYIEMSELSAYPVHVEKCKSDGCPALWLHDSRDRDYYIDCKVMEMDDDGSSYCDKHIPPHMIDVFAHRL